MPATPAWLASVEALLNRNIDASGKGMELAQRLSGTCIQIDVEGWTSRSPPAMIPRPMPSLQDLPRRS
jgi:ubiquinone biosynthesis protein UbiJ